MRLIDAVKLNDDILHDIDIEINNDSINHFIDLVDEQPEIDAEPVVHAHWEKGYYEEQGRKTNYFYCSHCLGTHDFKSNYCEDCGAIMDEEAEQK